MDILIDPKPLSGTVTAVPSKSHAQRLLLASALCENPPAVLLSNSSDDIEAMKACARQLHISGQTTFSGSVPVFDCGESGAVLRFLLPTAIAQNGQAHFVGRGRLPERPLSSLCEQLEAHGCRFHTAASGTSEARTICAGTGRLKSGRFSLPGNISSQYISGLLFALPLLAGDSQLHITTEIESLPYISMTLQVLHQFGIDVQSNDIHGQRPSFFIPGNQKYHCTGPLTPEGDWSSASFWYAADILSHSFGMQVQCRGLDPDSLQADRQIAALCQLYRKKHSAKPFIIDAAQTPDLVPILAVLACSVPAVTYITNAARLRLKESDRLASTADMLIRLGGHVQQHPDGLAIQGTGSLKGGAVKGYNDHRIVMAAAIASILCCEPVRILGAEAVSKSYPSFFEDFSALGGICHVL